MRNFLLTLMAWGAIASAQAGLTDAELRNFVLPEVYSQVALSPDGTRLAANVLVGEDRNMVIMDITDPRNPKVTYQFKQINDESIVSMRWASNERVLYQTTNTFGQQNEEFLTGRIYAINYNGKRGALVMGPTTGRSVFLISDIVDTLPDDKYRILATTRSVFGDRAEQLERINIYTGARNTVGTSAFDNGGLYTDSKNRVRFADSIVPATLEVRYAYKPDPDGPWVEFENPFDADVQFITINDAGTEAVFQRNDTGRAGIVALNLETKEVTVLSAHPKVEVSGAWGMRDESGDRVVYAVYEPDGREIDFIDEDSSEARLFKRLFAAFPGHAVVMSGGRPEQTKRLLTVYSDRQPPRYFLFDRETQAANYLFDTRPGIKADEMGERKAYWIKARDGVEFQVYVTRPANAPEGPLPAVFYIHGGPFGIRDSWAFDPIAQLLAKQGYAVIQPNFRGSAGQGQQFIEMGYKRWGMEMQDDVTDATHWAFEQGIADPNKTCIYGWSYGGYATLAAVTKEPGLYTCAFSMAGVYDLPMMYRRGDTNDAQAGRTFLRQAIGDDKDDMVARSPAYQADKIITPLFLAHGKADIRVPIQQLTSLTSSLDKAGVPYDQLILANEAHTLYGKDSLVTYYSTLFDFLERHIGPNAPGKAATTASNQAAADREPAQP